MKKIEAKRVVNGQANEDFTPEVKTPTMESAPVAATSDLDILQQGFSALEGKRDAENAEILRMAKAKLAPLAAKVKVLGEELHAFLDSKKEFTAQVRAVDVDKLRGRCWAPTITKFLMARDEWVDGNEAKRSTIRDVLREVNEMTASKIRADKTLVNGLKQILENQVNGGQTWLLRFEKMEVAIAELAKEVREAVGAYNETEVQFVSKPDLDALKERKSAVDFDPLSYDRPVK